MFFEIRDEIESPIIRRCEPNIIFNSIIRLVHYKLSHYCSLVYLLVTSSFQEVDEFLSIFLSNEHRGNPDAAASSIIAHDNILNVFIAVIDYNCDCNSNVLHIAHLFNERTFSSLCYEERCDVSVSVKSEGDLWQFVAGFGVIGVVVEPSNLRENN